MSKIKKPSESPAHAAVFQEKAIRRAWQLEQHGLHPLLARLYAARGVQNAAELDYAFWSDEHPVQRRLTRGASAGTSGRTSKAQKDKYL